MIAPALTGCFWDDLADTGRSGSHRESLGNEAAPFRMVGEEFAVEQQFHTDMGRCPRGTPSNASGGKIVEHQFLTRGEPAMGVKEVVGCMVERHTFSDGAFG